RFGAFVKILLPLVAPGLVATSVFCFIQAWNEFFLAYVLLSSAEKQTLTLWLAGFYGTSRGTDWGGLMAGATLTAIPVVIFFLLVQRRIAFGLTAGAVRGGAAPRGSRPRPPHPGSEGRGRPAGTGAGPRQGPAGGWLWRRPHPA